MKKFKIIGFLSLAAISIMSCHDKRSPGKVYMPDMAYSRAYEANMENSLTKDGINYNPTPVEGTIRRGDELPYGLPNDSSGYAQSAAIKSPIAALDSNVMLEAQRLYSINCGICHGPNMDAQGPLAGKVGGIANLKAGSLLTLPEGTIFHVVTYGKGNMGSYASQLSRKQRWMVVQYVKQEQNKALATKAASESPASGATTKTATPDSAKAGGTK